MSETRSTRGSRHAIGVYGANADGEMLPPFYIFDYLFPKAGPGKLLRDDKGKIVRHPVVVKIDTGPGRLGASLKNIERREAALKKGIILLLGLPNSTSVSQELDW